MNYWILSFQFLPHCRIRGGLCVWESKVESERDGERFQTFWEIWLFTKATQVYLNKTFCCEHYANALDIFNVYFMSPFAMYTRYLLILHEVRVLGRSLDVSCCNFSKWEVEKLRKLNCWVVLHWFICMCLCVRGKLNTDGVVVSVCECNLVSDWLRYSNSRHASTHTLEELLNLIFTLTLDCIHNEELYFQDPLSLCLSRTILFTPF